MYVVKKPRFAARALHAGGYSWLSIKTLRAAGWQQTLNKPSAYYPWLKRNRHRHTPRRGRDTEAARQRETERESATRTHGCGSHLSQQARTKRVIRAWHVRSFFLQHNKKGSPDPIWIFLVHETLNVHIGYYFPVRQRKKHASTRHRCLLQLVFNRACRFCIHLRRLAWHVCMHVMPHNITHKTTWPRRKKSGTYIIRVPCCSFSKSTNLRHEKYAIPQLLVILRRPKRVVNLFWYTYMPTETWL